MEERLARPIKLLLVATFLMNVGAFAVVPFLAVYLTKSLHYTAWEVGSVLTVQLLCARLLPMITGPVGDRLSHSKNMVIGVILRGAGFIMMAQSESFAWMVSASVLLGGGSAWYDPSVSAVFANQPEKDRKRTFTYYNQALNSGAVLGPLAGGVLVAYDPLLPFYWGGAVFGVIAALLLAYRRHYRTSRTSKRLGESMVRLWKHREFIRFTVIMILFWAIYAQLSVSYPLEAMRLTEDEGMVSMLFVVNGLSGVGLMFVLRRYIEKNRPLAVVRTGLIWLASSFLFVPLFPAAGMLWLFACMLLFTLGETLVLPGADLAIAAYSNQEEAGAFFGIYKVSWAVGGTIGNYSGAWMMQQEAHQLPWIVYGLLGLCAWGMLSLMDKQKNEHTTRQIHQS